MKKRLAKWLLMVVKRLDPQTHIENYQVIEGFEAKKLGLKFILTREDINRYRPKRSDVVSFNTAKSRAIFDTMERIRNSIFKTIDDTGLIEFHVDEGKKQCTVSGHLNIYVPKSDGDAED